MQILLHHRGVPDQIAFSFPLILRHISINPLICLETSRFLAIREGPTTPY